MMDLNISDLVLYVVLDTSDRVVLKSVCSIEQIGSLGGVVAKEECRLSTLTLGLDCVSIDPKYITKNFGKLTVPEFKEKHPEMLL